LFFVLFFVFFVVVGLFLFCFVFVLFCFCALFRFQHSRAVNAQLRQRVTLQPSSPPAGGRRRLAGWPAT
jgi:fatty acid desaturase